ncbi:MAG TPA: T9SS type A sorting domain-containing protein [Chitinophagaceae bacterium]|nr:T9SS type A sorting domain-containing protein [Chitinophagaceae bacterium]
MKHPYRLLSTSFALILSFSSLLAQDDRRKTDTGAPALSAVANRIIECPPDASHSQPCWGVTNRLFQVAGGLSDPVDPFLPDVDHWTRSHGTPQLNVFGPPPAALNLPGGTNYASMWARGTNAGEGIIGNITCGMPLTCPWPIRQGHTYVLSFYRQFLPEQRNWANRLDELNVYLMNCDQLPTQWQQTIPAIPAGAQQIYCETNINNTNIARITVQFTAQSNYQMLWIFPRHNSGGQAWLNIAMPEITEAFVWGETLWDGLTNSYSVGLGGCWLINTLHEWLDPLNNVVWSCTYNGSNFLSFNCPPYYGPIPANPSNPQQYTYRVTYLNATTTNNTCSTPITSITSSPYSFRTKSGTEGREEVPAEKVGLRYDQHLSTVVVTTNNFTEETFTLTVYDAQGKLMIKQDNQRAARGYNTIRVPIRKLAPGMYFMNIVMNGKATVQKFIVK